jgi:hypothetical protein
MTQPTTCPKCHGSMEQGLMLDRKDGGSDLQARWVRGEPTPRTFWGNVRLKGRKPLPVTTYRCEGCGYLESFAIRAS